MDTTEAPPRVQKNVELDADLAEWLRTQAFVQHTSQAEIVRGALEDLRARTDNAA